MGGLILGQHSLSDPYYHEAKDFPGPPTRGVPPPIGRFEGHGAGGVTSEGWQPEVPTRFIDSYILSSDTSLVEAALDEGDSERALQSLKATKPPGPEGYQWQYDYARTPDVALKAAERAEEAYPRASIDLYQQHVEHLIAGCGRSNYQVACSYLVKIRALYEKLDETEQWTTQSPRLRPTSPGDASDIVDSLP